MTTFTVHDENPLAVSQFLTLAEAVQHAYEHNDTAISILFHVGDEKVMLIRYYARNGNCFWVLEPEGGNEWVDDDPDEPLFEYTGDVTDAWKALRWFTITYDPPITRIPDHVLSVIAKVNQAHREGKL